MAFCTQCGAKLDKGVKFCLQCGTKVDSAENAAAAQPASPQIQPDAPAIDLAAVSVSVQGKPEAAENHGTKTLKDKGTKLPNKKIAIIITLVITAVVVGWTAVVNGVGDEFLTLIVCGLLIFGSIKFAKSRKITAGAKVAVTETRTKRGGSGLGCLFMLVLLIAGGFAIYRYNYPLHNTTWQQTGGAFYGRTGFIIDFGMDTFVASNGNMVIKGDYDSYWLTPDSESKQKYDDVDYTHFTIAGNGIEIGGASFRKIDKNPIQQIIAAVTGNTGASGTANTGSGSGSGTDSVIFSKQAARGWFMEGYNEGYDKYGPYSGSPLYDVFPRMPAAVQNDANLPPAEKAAIANLYSAGYTAGWEDHRKGISPNAYRVWDNTSWGVYGPPYR